MPFPTGARAGDTPHDAATRLFTRARAMDRARATLPARIAALEARATEAPGASAAAAESERKRPRVEPRQSYKRFTSRGGLEIRVGRSAKDNDALTFHDSSPDDVWMHARGAAGSHVVLRWTRDETPPAADLEEAAMLAAWHSRARGSTVVPVDWTRRKHVRKPRGASPGSVVVAQAKTVMVRPSAAAVRAMRDRG
jgi:predicted ribosome quality control (RQC) complex YloA/Tae2 family protein